MVGERGTEAPVRDGAGAGEVFVIDNEDDDDIVVCVFFMAFVLVGERGGEESRERRGDD